MYGDMVCQSCQIASLTSQSDIPLLVATNLALHRPLAVQLRQLKPRNAKSILRGEDAACGLSCTKHGAASEPLLKISCNIARLLLSASPTAEDGTLATACVGGVRSLMRHLCVASQRT